jgi:hypothetical protein
MSKAHPPELKKFMDKKVLSKVATVIMFSNGCAYQEWFTLK